MDKRSLAAYVLMALFVVFTSIGFGMMHLAWGYVAAGIGCGIYGWLLGNNGSGESES